MSELNTGPLPARTRVSVITLFGMLLFGVALLLALPGSEVSSSAPLLRSGNPAGSSTMCWQVVSSPNQGTDSNYLYGVAAVSASDVWAVGKYSNGTTDRTLVLHWDGTTWSVVSSPNQGTGSNYLYAVAAVSANDVWAVGYYNNGSTSQTLVEQWDGTAWTIVSSPNQGTGSNYLYAVAAVSANDVWAVGDYYSGNTDHTLIERWNGSAWSVIPSEDPSAEFNHLRGVAAVSTNDAWAIGGYWGGSAPQTLVEHWNGTAWSVVPSPNVGSSNSNDLSGVAAGSANDAWAVGNYWDGSSPQTLVEHWNGTAWSVVPSSNPSSSYNDLHGVTAVATNDAWAVGSYGSGGTTQTLVEHWNGTAWSVVPSENVGTYPNYFYGVAAVPGGDIWSVGYYGGGQYYVSQTLVESYLPCGTPGPTHTPPVLPTNAPTGSTTPVHSPVPSVTPAHCWSGEWSIMGENYPVPATQMAVAAQDGMLYSFGGFTSSGFLAGAFKYDPETGIWLRLADLPAAVYGAGATSDGTYLYILGGRGDSGYSTAFYKYDPQTNSYTTLAPAPLATENHALVYLSGKVYRIAGEGQSGWFDTVDVYNISTNSWAAAAPYPIGATRLTAVAYGGYIYSGGGWTWGSRTGSTYRYDPSTNTWDDSAVADLPQARDSMASAVLHGRWIIAGGYISPSPDNSVVALDLASQPAGWETLPPMIRPSASTGGGSINDSFYIVTGSDLDTATQRYEERPCDASTPTPTVRPPSVTPTSSATPALCSPQWKAFAEPSTPGALWAVSIVSSNDIWAVGSSNYRTITMHWNGLEWTGVSSPNPGAGYNFLYAVDAISADDVWAGGYFTGGTSAMHYLLLHWNGTRWAVVPGPDLGTDNSTVYDVAAVSAADVWAVGMADNGLLALHWNGTAWSSVPLPSMGGSTAYLQSVSATSATDAWAVGAYYYYGTWLLAVLHWDGATWQMPGTPAPVLRHNANFFPDVDAISANDVWIASGADSISVSVPVTVHWNGTTWSLAPTPRVEGMDYSLSAIKGTSSSDVWAVGKLIGGNLTRALSLHWTGSSWRVEQTDDLSSNSSFSGLDVVSTSDVWAVGSYMSGGEHTLVERYGVPILFSDVMPASTFYRFVQCLACRGTISGYPDGSFKPNNNVTRGQLAKIVSNSAGFSDNQSTQRFQDVPVGSTFFQYIGRLTSRGYMSGYQCGGAIEPCIPPGNLPYFRPNNNATRGQLTKIVSNAAGFQGNIPTSVQTFTDVPPNSTFWVYVERLLLNRPGAMGGYACGGANEPCDPQQRPYFRPGNNVTRGQTSKIVANTFFPSCQAPAKR